MGSALDGIRVVDLSQMISAPYCSQVLADMGADVIKVESPMAAPGARTGLGPTVKAVDGSPFAPSAFWFACNRNKRSVLLDLKLPEAMEVLAGLVARADVVLENYSEATRQVLGLDETWVNAIKRRQCQRFRVFPSARETVRGALYFKTSNQSPAMLP